MAEIGKFFITAPSGLVGDQVIGYNNADLQEFNRTIFQTDLTKEGVANIASNGKLAVSGTVTNVSVNTGIGMVYGLWYKNDLAFNIAIPTPTVSTRVDRIVLRGNMTSATYSGQTGYTVRAVRITQSEGIGTAPALTQNANQWEIPLATVSITTGGVITVTDERTYLKPPVVIDGTNLNSVLTYAGTMTVSNTAPQILLSESDQGADEKLWRWVVNSKVMFLQTLSDDKVTATTVISATRGSGIAISSIGLGANTAITGTLSTSGAATLASLAVTAGATIGTTLAVSGATTMAALTTSGSTSLASGNLIAAGAAVTINGTLAVSGATTLTTSLAIGTTLNVSGNTTLAGLSAGASTLSSLTVSGASGLAALTTSGTASLAAGSLVVTGGAATVNGTLTVTGATGLAGLTTSGNTSLTAGTLVITGGAVTVNGTLNVSGTITGALSGNATTASLATLATTATTANAVANDAVTNAGLANMTQATVKGRAAAAGTGDPVDLTADQLVAVINTATSGAALSIAGNASLTSGTLVVSGGAATVNGTLSVTGGITANVTGNLTGNASTATTASNATAIADGTVSTAAKVVDNVLTMTKFATTSVARGIQTQSITVAPGAQVNGTINYGVTMNATPIANITLKYPSPATNGALLLTMISASTTAISYQIHNLGSTNLTSFNVDVHWFVSAN